MQIRVRQRFTELQSADHDQVSWHTIDASQSQEAVREEIIKVVHGVLEDVSHGKELRKLWTDGFYDLNSSSDDGQNTASS